jgi:hypothetical protein
MVTQNFIPKWLAYGLTLVMALANLTPFVHTSVASAQTAAPPACRNDRGQPVRPNPAYLMPGWTSAWVLVTNFNHTPSASITIGCLGVITSTNPQQVNYSLVQCPLINNVNQVQVGGGNAPFDGNFWIECPGPYEDNNLHTSFSVLGRAMFPAANSTYTLMSQQDVDISADVDASWRMTLNSRYGANTYSNFAAQSNVAGKIIHFVSEVDNGLGAHYLNGHALAPRFMASTFGFDQSKPIWIGAEGQAVTLYEMIIDPPGMCCRGS